MEKIKKQIINMEDKKLQNGIDEIQKIKMTALEKRRVFENVIHSNIPFSKKPVRSPWFNYSFISRIQKKQLVFYVVIPLIFILTSGGLVFASQDSLPDSILYPIKVNVVEPIVGALTFSPNDQAKYQINLATKRLVEAETLASQGKLNKPTEKKLDNLLDNHTVALNKALDKVSKTETSDQVDEIVTSFHAGMNAHARVLDIINGQDKNTFDNQDPNIQVSNIARSNANNVKNFVSNKDVNNSDKYRQKKNSIQSLIDSATASLDSTSVGNNNSDMGQKIINDTHQALDQAKQYLDTANQNEKNGNGKDAYTNLLNSESSAKEANIFLKTGLKLGGRNNRHNGN
jgi:hypothetical protein